MLQRRMMLTGIVTIVVLALAITAAPADTIMSNTSNTSSGTVFQGLPKPTATLRSMSLLDPSRFTMSHRYVMSYGSGGGMGNGSLMGLYINTMEYRFNAPVIMRLKMAYQTGSSSLFGGDGSSYTMPYENGGQMYVDSFDIVYKPFKNTTFGIHYRDYRGAYGMNSMYGPYGYMPYGSRRRGYSPFSLFPYSAY